LYAACTINFKGDGVWAWNGSSWSQLGGSIGLQGDADSVTHLAIDGNTLYAGTGSGVWSWNGSGWSQVGGANALGGGAANINSLALKDDVLYAVTVNHGGSAAMWSWNSSTGKCQSPFRIQQHSACREK
jgi:hypothetical protein